MPGYRYEIDASLMFTVHADTEAEALKRANEMKDALIDGIDVDLGFDDAKDERLYPDELAALELSDVEYEDHEQETGEAGA